MVLERKNGIRTLRDKKKYITMAKKVINKK